MTVLDPRAIRADAERALGEIPESPATWGVLPEGIVVESGDGKKFRLSRSEPCLFLGPPARSRLVLAVAILDPSETAPDPVRAFVTVPVVQLAGLWVSGLEDAVARFPVEEVERERPEVLALPAGTKVWRRGEVDSAPLSATVAAVAIGRERGGARRRAAALVKGAKILEVVFVAV